MSIFNNFSDDYNTKLLKDYIIHLSDLLDDIKYSNKKRDIN